MSAATSSRGRRVALLAMVPAVGTLALFGATLEEGLQRRQMERLRSRDPVVRDAAAAKLREMLPRLKPANGRLLAQVLEEAGTPQGPPSQWLKTEALDAASREIVWQEVRGLFEEHPDFYASPGDDPPYKPRPSRLAPFSADSLFDHVREIAGAEAGIWMLSGRLALRAEPRVVDRVVGSLHSLRSHVDLFNSLFDPMKIDHRAGRALTLLLEEPGTSVWLRGCALHALARVDPAAAVRYR